MNGMGKITMLGAGAAFGLLVATASVSAQESPCRGVVEHRLQEYGLTMGDLTEIEWIAQRSGRQHQGPVVSYHMWSLPKSCTSGNLVIDMNAACYIATVYTQGGCTVKGIPSY